MGNIHVGPTYHVIGNLHVEEYGLMWIVEILKYFIYNTISRKNQVEALERNHTSYFHSGHKGHFKLLNIIFCVEMRLQMC